MGISFYLEGRIDHRDDYQPVVAELVGLGSWEGRHDINDFVLDRFSRLGVEGSVFWLNVAYLEEIVIEWESRACDEDANYEGALIFDLVIFKKAIEWSKEGNGRSFHYYAC